MKPRPHPHPSTRPSLRRRRAFTLIELLIVIVILAILAAVVIRNTGNATAWAKEASVRTNLAMIRRALDVYRTQHGDTYPDADIKRQLLQRSNSKGGAGRDYGPYLRAFPVNIVNGSADVRIVSTRASAPAGREGWVYVSGTGIFRANVGGTGPNGVAYFEL